MMVLTLIMMVMMVINMMVLMVIMMVTIVMMVINCPIRQALASYLCRFLHSWKACYAKATAVQTAKPLITHGVKRVKAIFKPETLFVEKVPRKP